MWDPSTIAVNQGELSLVRGLDATAPRRPSLIVFSGAEVGKPFGLDAGVTLIGRSAEAGLQFNSPGISRRHAELAVDGDRVELRDLGSANGTHLNNQRLEQPCTLKDGDLLRLGSVVLKFYSRESLDALLHERLYRQAMVDGLTGVYSRKFLDDALQRELRLAQRSGRLLSVVCFDLDAFKQVNDRYGHAAGDLVLRRCADAVRQVLRASDLLGRYGGEEFLVILPDTGRDTACELAERIRAAVAALEFELACDDAAGRRLVRHRQTVSLGVAQWQPDMATEQVLLETADRRLYEAKHGGRNRVSG